MKPATLNIFDRSAARSPRGPGLPFLASGFRPFYLCAGGLAVLWVPLWLAVLSGTLPLASHFDPVAWHAHEMLFGYTMAVLIGFLYTAVPNWTGQPTPTGAPLAGLALLWLAGRLLVLCGADLPPWLVAAVDAAFLPAAALGILPALVRTRNRRNIAFPFALVGLAAASLLMHLEAMGIGGLGGGALRATLGIMTVILVVMTGRVVPFFTRNRLPQSGATRNERLDRAAFVATILAVAAAVLLPQSLPAGGLALAAAALLLLRMLPWRSWATRGEPMLWILHLGHLWIGVALLLQGLAELGLAVQPSLPVHALTIGAIGSLTLGMMARSALGHSGRPIAAGSMIRVAFWAINVAAAVRVFVPLITMTGYEHSLHVAAAAWTVAFGLFVFVFLPILVRPRIDGRPG